MARTCVELRVAQRQLRLTRDDIAAMEQRLNLIEVRVNAGTLDHVNLEQQRAELSGLRSQVPGLMCRQARTRTCIVHLRELRQQEAAVDYHHTVLQAWEEIDNALSGYTADRQQAEQLLACVASASEAYKLIQVKYDAGTVDFLSALDSQRTYLQARRDLVTSQGQLHIQFVAVNSAIGNTPTEQPNFAQRTP